MSWRISSGWSDKISTMILRESVKNILLRHPYKHGKIGLPRNKYDIFSNYKICDGKYSVELIDAENREYVKSFMLGIKIKSASVMNSKPLNFIL